MSDINPPEHPSKTETPQEKLRKLWNRPDAWIEGFQVRTEGLPEGMRLIETGGNVVLRSAIPGLPQIESPNHPNDVPVSVFSERADPKDIIKEARELTVHILNGEISYEPPQAGK